MDSDRRFPKSWQAIVGSPIATEGAVNPPGTLWLDRTSIRNWLAQQKDSTVDRKQTAESLGVTFSKQEPGYLAMVVQSGQQLITSGHVSDLKGKLGSGLTVEEGQVAARQCAAKILNSVWNFHGTLEGLRVLKVLGCVNSTLEFHEQHLVINGCSDLLHSIFGKTTDGYHARSALGFAQLPTGAAVEVEAIFEILPS